MSGQHATGTTHTHTLTLAYKHITMNLPALTLTGGTPSTPSLLLAAQQGVLDCRVHQPQASYLYQPIIVFCQYSVSHGIVHSSYYTIQYIRINVRYVLYLSSVLYVLSDTVLTHIIITTPGCTVLTPYTVGLIRCN